jgi:hypothetical protein
MNIPVDKIQPADISTDDKGCAGALFDEAYGPDWGDAEGTPERTTGPADQDTMKPGDGPKNSDGAAQEGLLSRMRDTLSKLSPQNLKELSDKLDQLRKPDGKEVKPEVGGPNESTPVKPEPKGNERPGKLEPGKSNEESLLPDLLIV